MVYPYINAFTHTHTHTHICIYIYIYICKTASLQLISANSAIFSSAWIVSYLLKCFNIKLVAVTKHWSRISTCKQTYFIKLALWHPHAWWRGMLTTLHTAYNHKWVNWRWLPASFYQTFINSRNQADADPV